MRVVMIPATRCHARRSAGGGRLRLRRCFRFLKSICLARVTRSPDSRRPSWNLLIFYERDCSVSAAPESCEVLLRQSRRVFRRALRCGRPACTQSDYRMRHRRVSLRRGVAKWYFIEVNPRIQSSIPSPRWSPALTGAFTNSSCARDKSSRTPMALPNQENIPLNGPLSSARDH